MATFISHPLFGLGASYIVSHPQTEKTSKQFIILSTLCQWFPDIDTCAYLFHIDEQHPLGHRGMAHSGVFALVLAWAVMRIFYRSLKFNRLQWWGYFFWFFLMTLFHGLFDALVNSSLGVAFFWPFDNRRYVFAWRPLMDVPIRFAEFFHLRFWHAQWIECQFFSFLLVSFYVACQLWQSYLQRSPARITVSMNALASKS